MCFTPIRQRQTIVTIRTLNIQKSRVYIPWNKKHATKSLCPLLWKNYHIPKKAEPSRKPNKSSTTEAVCSWSNCKLSIKKLKEKIIIKQNLTRHKSFARPTLPTTKKTKISPKEWVIATLSDTIYATQYNEPYRRYLELRHDNIKRAERLPISLKTGRESVSMGNKKQWVLHLISLFFFFNSVS